MAATSFFNNTSATAFGPRGELVDEGRSGYNIVSGGGSGSGSGSGSNGDDDK
ncbi:hypothetical protein JDV02_004904 [Purpureocillium takamizusanense]|uniref:Uncharacterized protein n=1 Tax=Purpureocillium takamizusanense TaxID=2060973 RepID=A0A9Q8VB89_9HYPO|nr:uncharacterized protein JDV02_004904 [Purpureocillium takamizusanense]UNI18649.1 hypothetical protein JDV02_004904 [Purpureocillium takamizusanense]